MLVGVIRPGAHARWLMRHRGIRLAIIGAAGLSVRPLTGLRFLQRRARRYANGWIANRRVHGAPSAQGPESAVLSHVAVVDGARRTGAGRQQVRAFVDACRAHYVARVTLLTLEADGAGGFYERLGWRPGQVRMTPDGHRMREWFMFTANADR